MRVGLVLGAGGIQGGAWLTGGLDALAEETGWDPAEADYVVGTSAGSMIGALCASGIPPWFMVAHSRGEVFEGVVDAAGARPPRPTAPPAPASISSARWPPIGPGSWRLALRTLANPAASHPPPCSPAGSRAASSRPSRSRTRSAASSRAAGARTRTCGSSPATTRPAAASPFGRAGAPRRRPRRRRRRLLRDPGHLPPGDDRRAPLRRRRHLLRLERRPPARREARPRHLPQPDLHPAPHSRDQPPRRLQHRVPAGLRPPAR